MALDAGHIRGHLDLDTTSFNEGIHEAHTHAETEGGRIREIFEALAETLSEIVGPAFAVAGQQLQSAFAGFSEGPLLGTLNAVGIAAGDLREATQDVAEELHEIGLAADKAGVSVEFLGKIAAAGKTVNISLDQIGLGLKMLEERAQSAAEGDKGAVKAFERIGISSAEAAKLASDPENLWQTVQGKISGVAGVTERLKDAQMLVGQRGTALIPILKMSADEYEHNAEKIEKLEGVTTKASVKMADSVIDLEKQATAAWDGIKKKTTQPIFEYITAHHGEIEDDIGKLQGVVIEKLGLIQGWFGQHKDELKNDGEALVQMFQGAAEVAEHLAKGTLELLNTLKELSDFVAQHVNPAPAAGTSQPSLKGVSKDEAAKQLEDASHFRSADGFYPNPNDDPEHKKNVAARHHGMFMPSPSPSTSQSSSDHVSSRIQQALSPAAGTSSASSAAYTGGDHAAPKVQQTMPARTNNTIIARIEEVLRQSATSRSPSGGRTGNQSNPAGNVTYNVNLTAQTDPDSVASKLMPKIVDALRKVHKQQDQALNGKVSANNVAASMGGG